MKKMKVMVIKYGYVNVEADTESEALEKAINGRRSFSLPSPGALTVNIPVRKAMHWMPFQGNGTIP